MFSPSHFHTFAFPWYLISLDGKILTSGNGTLFLLPEGAKSESCIQHYRTCPVGWTTCPAGYAVYCVNVNVNVKIKLVFPGLKVTGVSTVSGRSDLLSIKTRREHVERYLGSALQAPARLNEEFGALVRAHMHEIRRINTNIYHASYASERELSKNNNMDTGAINRYTKNVSGLSQILKIRADYLDFLSNPSLEAVAKQNVFVYRKFDKVAMGIRPTARRRRIRVEVKGESHGTIQGLPIFEIAPYVVIDNAVKYSPEDQTVEVELGEDQNRIWANVQSMGPSVKPEEQDRIFDEGYSGEFARQTGRAGSGVGLYVLRAIVERLHDGTVAFQQNGVEISIDEVPYRNTVVSLVLPRAS